MCGRGPRHVFRIHFQASADAPLLQGVRRTGRSPARGSAKGLSEAHRKGKDVPS